MNQMMVNAKMVDCVRGEKLWVVHAKSVLGRIGPSIKSDEVGRWKQFTFLEGIEWGGKDNKRLHVKKLLGVGPETGWVTPVAEKSDAIIMKRVESAEEVGQIRAKEFDTLFADVTPKKSSA